jgi:hypothetical protein
VRTPAPVTALRHGRPRTATTAAACAGRSAFCTGASSSGRRPRCAAPTITPRFVVPWEEGDVLRTLLKAQPRTRAQKLAPRLLQYLTKGARAGRWRHHGRQVWSFWARSTIARGKLPRLLPPRARRCQAVPPAVGAPRPLKSFASEQGCKGAPHNPLLVGRHVPRFARPGLASVRGRAARLCRGRLPTSPAVLCLTR